MQTRREVYFCSDSTRARSLAPTRRHALCRWATLPWMAWRSLRLHRCLDDTDGEQVSVKIIQPFFSCSLCGLQVLGSLSPTKAARTPSMGDLNSPGLLDG